MPDADSADLGTMLGKVPVDGCDILLVADYGNLVSFCVLVKRSAFRSEGSCFNPCWRHF
jgi:hypothetical protein